MKASKFLVLAPWSSSLSNLLQHPDHFLCRHVSSDSHLVQLCIDSVSLNICTKTRENKRPTRLWHATEAQLMQTLIPSIFFIAFLIALMHSSQCIPTFSSTNCHYTQEHIRHGEFSSETRIKQLTAMIRLEWGWDEEMLLLLLEKGGRYVCDSVQLWDFL